jgi:TonB-dependent SusC/RagA subfamily outer membrane receptor
MNGVRCARATLVAALVTIPALACGSRRPSPSTAARPDTVSIGYGTQARKDVVGAVTTLTAGELDAMRVARVEELLQGRVPGLQILRQSNGEYSIRIRGTNSIMGSNEPLIVIDGVPLRTGGFMNALAGIVPQDIARIDVLKDAGSTAIYGSQGANGVIIITTKRRY